MTLGFVLSATLAACSNAPPLAPAPTVRSSQPPIDGTYDGLMQLTRGEAINCGNQNEFTLHVINHSFSYRLAQPQADWKPVIVFTATIGSDGSFNAQSGTGFIRGSVAGGTIQGAIGGDICGFSFTADRGGPW